MSKPPSIASSTPGRKSTRFEWGVEKTSAEKMRLGSPPKHTPSRWGQLWLGSKKARLEVVRQQVDVRMKRLHQQELPLNPFTSFGPTSTLIEMFSRLPLRDREVLIKALEEAERQDEQNQAPAELEPAVFVADESMTSPTPSKKAGRFRQAASRTKGLVSSKVWVSAWRGWCTFWMVMDATAHRWGLAGIMLACLALSILTERWSAARQHKCHVEKGYTQFCSIVERAHLADLHKLLQNIVCQTGEKETFSTFDSACVARLVQQANANAERQSIEAALTERAHGSLARLGHWAREIPTFNQSLKSNEKGPGQEHGVSNGSNASAQEGEAEEKWIQPAKNKHRNARRL